VDVPGRPADRATELAAIEAKYRARCDEINSERAQYDEWLRGWVQRRREKAIEGGVPPALYLRVLRSRSRRPMTPAEADARRDALLREARDVYLRDLKMLELRTRIVTGGAHGLSRAEVRSLARQIVTEIDERNASGPAPEKRGPKLTEVPLGTLRRVAELRIGGETVAAIMRDTGLSKTVATRLVRDVDDAFGRIMSGRYLSS
jgi:hypothetical protein